MKNLLSFCILSLLLFTGCNNDDTFIVDKPNQLVTRSAESMTVENGIFVFSDYDSYYNVFKELYQLNKEELIQWDERMDYKSLLTKDINTKNYVENVDNEEELEELEKEGELDDVRKALYSDKGLLIIEDTLYKVIDDYIYKIPRNSQISLLDVESTPENYSDIRFKHTISLKTVPSPSLYNIMDTRYVQAVDRSDTEARSMLVKVSKKRREHVKFKATVYNDGKLLYLKIVMIGRAQKKKLGIWGNTFNDEIVWGEGRAYFEPIGVDDSNPNRDPDIIISRVENSKEIFNRQPHPMGPISIPFISRKVSAFFDFYKNDVSKEQYIRVDFTLK